MYGLRHAWKSGLPSFLSHDFHLPIGWTLPRAVYLEPGLARLCGRIAIADADEEGAALRRAVLHHLRARIVEQEDDFKALIAELGEWLTGDGDRVPAECVAIWERGLALRAFPGVFAGRDDDGLVPVSALDVIAPGVYRVGKLAVFAHSYFRRGLSPFNTLNGAFLRTLHDLPETVHPRVSLDPDLVGLADTYKWQLEHQFWWGPRFSEDLASIAAGVSVHVATEEQRLFHGISRTEFWWQSRKGEHILEVEEIRDRPTFDPEPTPEFGCRYVHSIVVEETGKLDHFDGAVRTYSEEEMLERLDVKLPGTGRDKQYTKLWRMDGDVGIATWKRLLSDYFRDNQLVGEYLGAEAQRAEVMVSEPGTESSNELPESRLDEVVFVQPGEGPRVSLYFRPMVDTVQTCTIVPLRSVGTTSEKPIIELMTLDLVKLLRKNGHDVALDDGVGLYEADDLYYNFPMLWHSDAGEVAHSIEALHTLVRRWVARGVEGAASVTLAYPLDGEGLAISIRGSFSDLETLFNAWPRRLAPHQRVPEALADAVSSILSDWPHSNDPHNRFADVFSTGILDYPRMLLDPSEVELKLGANGDVGADLMLDRHRDPQLVAAIEAGRFHMRPVWIVGDPGCRRCGGRYRLCSCSSVLDGAVVHMRGAEIVGVMLTDRPA